MFFAIHNPSNKKLTTFISFLLNDVFHTQQENNEKSFFRKILYGFRVLWNDAHSKCDLGW